ncbi:MAG: DUF4363 family protein [Firmicutes bacterium]|nr:DUF4363 family protein [Bacillota bacterium]
MKRIWLAVILLLVVLTGSVALFLYTDAQHDHLQEQLQRIHLAAEDEDWGQAHRESEQLKEIWSRTDASWTPIMDHRQVDRLDESLTRVGKLVEMRNREELLIEIAVAMRTAKRIKETELPSLRNIF